MGIDRDKRALVRGAPGRKRAPLRPPWAVDAFEDACTRCGACLAACPEGILTVGDGGFPEVDFRRGSGECTFCSACADACPEPAFRAPDDAGEAPWQARAEIGAACLAQRGIHCQSCGDACPEAAITFALRHGGPPQPRLDSAACTGCGACVGACPVDAISIVQEGVPANA